MCEHGIAVVREAAEYLVSCIHIVPYNYTSSNLAVNHLELLTPDSILTTPS